MFARIGVMRALNRHVERVFNPERKDHHWGPAQIGARAMILQTGRLRHPRPGPFLRCTLSFHQGGNPAFDIFSQHHSA